MIDFEVVGDLLRKAGIPQQVKMKETPVIIADAPVDEDHGDLVEFIFDSAGNLKGLRVR